jgi:hypothetical protein
MKRLLVLVLVVIVLAAVALPPSAASPDPVVRFATFNVSLNRSAEGALIADLSKPDSGSLEVEQAATVAEIVQRVRPDVLLLNELDYDKQGTAARLFQENFLSVSQNGAAPIEYPYRFVAPSNTGIPSGFDLNRDGKVGGPVGTIDYANDAFGFGFFPGQFGMAVLSRYPIDPLGIRTFQRFRWKDMPGALQVIDPATGEPWYSDEALEVFRLSSKSHWDVPVRIGETTVHLLASHPTPPVFDGPEDRNGKRNHDEIRFWADYVTPGRGGYIYDDAGRRGGLRPGSPFVVAGDQNADPFDGDSVPGAIQQLLESPLVSTRLTPRSEGGVEQARLQGGANETHRGDPAFDTADFRDVPGPGNLRVDYVLPRRQLEMVDAGVFWPLTTDPLFPLVGVFDPDLRAIGGFPSSDHRLVWVDVKVPNGG